MPLQKDDGPLSRVPPEAKLLALFAASVLLFSLSSPPALAAVAGLLCLATLLLCRSALVAWMKAWPLLLTIATLGLWTWFARGPEAAAITVLRLGSLSLFATIVTVTTSIGQFIDTIARLALPLERLGLANARDIGLAIGLVIRLVPEIRTRYSGVIAAHRARGLKVRPATIIVPLVISTMLSADEIAHAIDARNLRDTGPRI
ncbi:energy-coupling factor transporter transmembrane component T family protein [Devosia faecipullorum]|uniref:energy-coupling factor transporter transmembrane component T family protein n=1 Tax=Devosia faecipullorum TaxID=2755039 RepID=UPI001E46DF96|nr:energy-coupling factor transporter transmembrane protein EcfT [Devosia faecipullorum]